MRNSNIFGYRLLTCLLVVIFVIGCTEGGVEEPNDPTPPQEEPPVNDDDEQEGDKDDEDDTLVKKEDMVQYIEESQSVIDPWFEECDSIDELSMHISDIESMDCVSSVKVEDETLYVTLNGGLTIGWSYKEYPSYSGDYEENSQPSSVFNRLQSAKIQTADNNGTEHNVMSNLRIGLIDLTRDPFKGYQALQLISSLSNANIINADYAEWIFATSDDVFQVFSDCNLIWFMTHGKYHNSKYSILLESNLTIIGDDFSRDEEFDTENIHYVKRKVLDSIEIYVEKWATETYIQNNLRLRNDAIVFCGACKSLKDSTSFANIFKDKGAVAYLGYTDSNSVGAHAGRSFVENMLKGMTVKQAYEDLSNRWKMEGSAILKGIYWRGGENYCIVHPEVKTIQIEEKDIDGDKVVVKGVIEEVNKNQLLEMTPGFCWSTTNSKLTIDNCDGYENLKKVTGVKKDKVDFQYEIENLELNTKYYYRAYMHINNEVWYGDVNNFTVEGDAEAEIKKYFIELYESTNGDNWINNTNWCSSKPLKEWYGVYKDWQSDTYAVELQNNNLTGFINLNNCSYIRSLSVIDNTIDRISIHKCENFEVLAAAKPYDDHTDINTIDISECNNLWSIQEPKKLDKLSISKCNKLTSIDCSDSELKELSIIDCDALTILQCPRNQLSILNISCSNLVNLDCSQNQLTKLDLENCPSLQYLNCMYNHILMEVPNYFRNYGWNTVNYFSMDFRYDYAVFYDYSDQLAKDGWVRTFEDGVFYHRENQYGWWFPGEPESHRHEWID